MEGIELLRLNFPSPLTRIRAGQAGWQPHLAHPKEHTVGFKPPL